MSLIAAGANELYPLPVPLSLSLSVLAALPTPFAVFARLMRRQTAGLDYAESLARARAVLVRPVRRARDPLRKFSVSFC